MGTVRPGVICSWAALGAGLAMDAFVCQPAVRDYQERVGSASRLSTKDKLLAQELSRSTSVGDYVACKTHGLLLDMLPPNNDPALLSSWLKSAFVVCRGTSLPVPNLSYLAA